MHIVVMQAGQVVPAAPAADVEGPVGLAAGGKGC